MLLMLMFFRLYLSAMHFNENVDHPQATSAGDPVFKVQFPKFKKGQGTAKPVKTNATFLIFNTPIFYSKYRTANYNNWITTTVGSDIFITLLHRLYKWADGPPVWGCVTGPCVLLHHMPTKCWRTMNTSLESWCLEKLVSVWSISSPAWLSSGRSLVGHRNPIIIWIYQRGQIVLLL